MKRAVVLSLAGALVALVACADLFDEASQCKSDRDCTKFGAVCDVARAVCVAAGTLPGDDASVTDGPATSTDGAAQDVVVGPNCDIDPKPAQDIPSAALADAGDSETGDLTLECDKVWNLKSRLFVKSGATLTIKAGVTIRADANAAIVVRPGAKIVAQGTRDYPIVMTSSAADPQPGDWRGLFVLGAAPPADQSYAGDAAYAFGGANDADDSGTLQFVRVEYANDGLVLGGVGNGTKIDFVQVRKSADNCFGIAGGRFDAKHLVCQYPSDEMFEVSTGYQGRLQFLYGQKVPLAAAGGGHNGFLVDGNALATVYNATFCGDDKPNLSWGLVVRNGGRLDLNGGIFTGWYAGFDAVGNLGTPMEVRRSIFFGNATNPAYPENDPDAGAGSPNANDDNGFDEVAFLNDGARANKLTDPGLGSCYDPKNPQPAPGASLTNGAPTPPNDGFFDTGATYIGAFKDQNDAWMKGAWVRFDDK